MRKWGVYHSLEEALHVLKTDEYSSVPEIREVLKVFSNSLANRSVEDENKSHPFVVLEGLDACGKTTVSRRLAKYCKGVVMSTPGPQYLPFRSFFDQQPTAVRRAYYSLSNYTAAMEISKALREHVVILDRFWHSTAAYALAGQAEDVAQLPEPGDPVYLWPKDLKPYPDAVFFLNVSETERLKRHEARNTTNTPEEVRLAKEAKFRAVLHDVYHRMDNPKVTDINADRPIDDVVKNILEILDGIKKSVV